MAIGSFQKWLVHRCDIEAGTSSQLATGEDAITYNLRSDGSAVACRLMIDTVTQGGGELSGQITRQYHLLLLPGQTITDLDRVSNVVDCDGNSVAGGPFRVEAILPRYGKRRALLKRVDLKVSS